MQAPRDRPDRVRELGTILKKQPSFSETAAAPDGSLATLIAEGSEKRTLELLATAEAIFREGDKDGNGLLDYGSLKQLAVAGPSMRRS